MPILLDTPFNGGDLESQPLTHVKITRFNVDLKHLAIRITTRRGYVSGSDFVMSNVKQVGSTIHDFVINDPEFSTMISAVTSAAGVLIYDEVARELYEWLISEGHFAGTIV